MAQNVIAAQRRLVNDLYEDSDRAVDALLEFQSRHETVAEGSKEWHCFCKLTDTADEARTKAEAEMELLMGMEEGN